MRLYWIVGGMMAAAFLGLFGVVRHLGLPLLVDPGPWLSTGGWAAAGVGFLLLVSDVVLPVPASLVMVAHGALFGGLWGTLLSLAGAVAAAALAFALGRRGGPLLARVASERERSRANELLERWGELAIIVSRPVPILAETVAIMAGTLDLGWGRFLRAALAGAVPAAALYAVTGATAAGLDSSILVFGLVLLIAGIFWLVGRRLRGQESGDGSRPPAARQRLAGD